MTKRIALLLVLGVMVGFTGASAQEADAIVGRWYTEDQKALVEIYNEAGVYNGRIVWLKESTNEDGTQKMDRNNPDPALQQRPLIGLNLVAGFSHQGGERWSGGSIYDPDNGKTYSCKMTLTNDTLKVRGFVGVSLFGRTTVWQRAE